MEALEEVIIAGGPKMSKNVEFADMETRLHRLSQKLWKKWVEDFQKADELKEGCAIRHSKRAIKPLMARGEEG